MYPRVRRHVTYANAMATVAVFIALGGSSYAAVKIGSSQIINNSVRSRDLHNNDVRGKDIRNGTVLGKDIRNRTVLGGDIAEDTLRGKDIAESTLGAVPLATNAGALDGIDSAAFLQGGGRVAARRLDVPCCDAQTTLLDVPGLGRVEGEVTNTGRVNTTFENTSGADITLAFHGSLVNSMVPSLEGNFVADLSSGIEQGIGMNNDNEVLFVTFQVSAPGRTATVMLSARNPAGTTAAAPFQAQYVLSTG